MIDTDKIMTKLVIGFAGLTGIVSLASLGGGIAGSVFHYQSKGELDNYTEIVDNYNNDENINQFVEENEDKTILLDNENQDNIVISENDWTRLKKLYYEMVINAENQYNAGKITIEELEQTKTRYNNEFRNTISLNQFITITNGQGFAKNYDEMLALSTKASKMVEAGFLTFGFAGMASIATSILAHYEIKDSREY